VGGILFGAVVLRTSAFLECSGGVRQSVYAGAEEIRGTMGDEPGNCSGGGPGKWIRRANAKLGRDESCLSQEVATDFCAAVYWHDNARVIIHELGRHLTKQRAQLRNPVSGTTNKFS
jgi:hypothetical protein